VAGKKFSTVFWKTGGKLEVGLLGGAIFFIFLPQVDHRNSDKKLKFNALSSLQGSGMPEMRN
jgi:hypothetical protein